MTLHDCDKALESFSIDCKKGYDLVYTNIWQLLIMVATFYYVIAG